MEPFINFVATRCNDGDHATLQRWYDDHVHLLLGSPDLQAATLYAAVDAASEGVPDYLCLYEFPSAAAFAAFESGAARRRAAQVVQEGWARGGITIVQRRQFRRLGRRGEGQCDRHALVSLLAEPAPGGDTERWFAGRARAWSQWLGASAVAWHRSQTTSPASEVGACGSADLLLLAHGGPGMIRQVPADDDWWCRSDIPDAPWHPDGVTTRWQGRFDRVCHWTR